MPGTKDNFQPRRIIAGQEVSFPGTGIIARNERLFQGKKNYCQARRFYDRQEGSFPTTRDY